MFFFFVGGMEQQAGRLLKEAAGRCVRCGSPVDLVEYEKVLKLFFVPVWRWPGNAPAYRCRDCSFLFPRSLPISDDEDASGAPRGGKAAAGGLLDSLRCGNCDRVVEAQFRYCPFCGTAL